MIIELENTVDKAISTTSVAAIANSRSHRFLSLVTTLKEVHYEVDEFQQEHVKFLKSLEDAAVGMNWRTPIG